MKTKLQTGCKPALAAALAAALTLLPMAAHADEREDLEKLRATVLLLIDTMVKTGLLPRATADNMMREAQRQAQTQLAQAPAPEVGADGKKIVRVPYLPEAVKAQMREQIKAELLAEVRPEALAAGAGGAATGNWGAPPTARTGSSPMASTASDSRIQIEGDLRLRAESIRPASDNSPARDVSFGSPDATRAPDLWANPSANTVDHADRTRIRARAGINVAVTEDITAGLAISTGGTTGPTSTNQSMATGAAAAPGFFNKYSLVVDKAFVRYQPLEWLSLTGGRFKNPFMSTDLVWADDLNFEGFAAGLKGPKLAGLDSFLTAGWFPLAFTSPGQSRHRDLLAIQGGVDWQLGTKDNHLKMAAALYGYSNIAGIKENTSDKSSVPAYVARSEYGAGYRQRGNTLFRINANPSVDSATNWGLASGFRELDLMASLDVAQFDPVHVVLTADLVHNLAFDRSAMERRTGLKISDGSATGYLVRAQVGAAAIKQRGDWNVSLTYRRLGSDAVLDAFTNSDFGLGGTNNKGFILGANYGIAKNSWLSARWLSAQNLESLVPAVRADAKQSKYSIDTLQVDLNTRF